MIVPIHILAGVLALGFGYTALWASKGAKLHRTSGLMGVYALLTMSVTGVWLAISRHVEANAIGGVLAAYLIFTALSTVRFEAAMVVAFVFGLTCVSAGFVTAAPGWMRRPACEFG